MTESSGSQQLDHRHSPRYTCAGQAEISQEGKRITWGRLTDISRGGCYIETERPLPCGADTQLRLTVAGASLDICAKVAGNTPLFGMGMQFVALSPEQDAKLAQIVNSIAASQAPAGQQAQPSQPQSTTVQITREAAPAILAMIIKKINEKGVLTRQDLIDIVKVNK
jgi:hypothetical protein